MLRHVARALLGAVFVRSGVDQIRHPEDRAAAAGPWVARLARSTPLPDDPVLVMRATGAVTVAGGLGLATSTAPRISATALAATLVPETAFGRRFWRMPDREDRDRESVRFLTNLGLLGGLILAALDTEGRPGLRYRARSGGRRAAAAARRTRRGARREARRLAREARLTQRVLAADLRADRVGASRSVERTARRTARRARRTAQRAAAAATDVLPGSPE